MSRVYLAILDSTGTKELTTIDFGTAVPGTAGSNVSVQVFNPDLTRTCANSTLGCCRSDMLISGPAGEDAENARANGDEISTEKYLEARVAGDIAWTALDEYASALSLGSIAAQAHLDVELRLNPASDADTFGDCGFCLIARCDP